MLRAGMISQSSSGIYSWLPLGLRVLKKIENIVRDEQDAAGVNEILMPTIQPADLWKESGRYEDYGKEMLRINDRQDREMLYWPTNEEQVTDIFRRSIKSYKELPQLLYHIQWKFRDELRPRFGVMRGREFLMKDAYSFDLDKQQSEISYNKFFVCYLKTFQRLKQKIYYMKFHFVVCQGQMNKRPSLRILCLSSLQTLVLTHHEISIEYDIITEVALYKILLNA
jgi:prolyl-tRNA synthetase